MTVLLDWRQGKRRRKEMSCERIAGLSVCRLAARAPGLRGLGNRRFWNRLFAELKRDGCRHVLTGGAEELRAMAEKFSMPPPSHLPLLRRLAAPLARYAAEPGMTPVLYSRQADPLTVRTAAALCDDFPQVYLCAGRQSESLAGYLYQKLGASVLIGDPGGKRLRIFLAAPETERLPRGLCLDLTLGGMGLPGSIRDAFLTGPEAEKVPAAYRTDLVCLLASADKKYEKDIKILGISGKAGGKADGTFSEIGLTTNPEPPYNMVNLEFYSWEGEV